MMPTASDSCCPAPPRPDGSRQGTGSSTGAERHERGAPRGPRRPERHPAQRSTPRHGRTRKKPVASKQALDQATTIRQSRSPTATSSAARSSRRGASSRVGSVPDPQALTARPTLGPAGRRWSRGCCGSRVSDCTRSACRCGEQGLLAGQTSGSGSDPSQTSAEAGQSSRVVDTSAFQWRMQQ